MMQRIGLVFVGLIQKEWTQFTCKSFSKKDPFFEIKENPTKEEIEENERWLKGFRENPVLKFLTRAEEVADELNEMELKENSDPYRMEDKKYWKSIPHVIGPDGRPMPRKAIKTKKESDDKFWDFAEQFFSGCGDSANARIHRADPLMLLKLLGIRGWKKDIMIVSVTCY